MNQQKNKILDWNAYQNTVIRKKLGESNMQYQCMLSGNRLEGYCEVLIYNHYQRNAEVFFLCFAKEGQVELQYFQEEEVILWKQYHATVYITYSQAMTLLGDAIRRVYREQNLQNEWSISHDSIHVRRIWQNAYYNPEQSNLEWLLNERDIELFIKKYFHAINNKDAVLLYDMMATSKKQELARELYAYHWNHVLEEVMIFDFSIKGTKKMENADIWIYHLSVFGESLNGEMLSIDVCLHFVYENGFARVQAEHVMGASHISNCCGDMPND